MPKKLPELQSNLRPLIKNHHGSAPMSNWVARFALTAQILAGVVLTVIDYNFILNSKIAQMRTAKSVWWPGFSVTACFAFVIFIVWILDKKGITKQSPLAIRVVEKKILLIISLIVLVGMLVTAIILG